MTQLIVNQLSIKKRSSTGVEITLVGDVSFSLNSGEILTIIGPNGAGKSTLLQAIANHCEHPIDTIEIKNLANDQTMAARQLAVLNQFSSLNFPFRVSEVLQLGRTPHSTGVKVDNTIINKVLNIMDITHLKHRLYTHLSGGEKQRVQIARVLTQIWRAEDAPQQSRLLLLDEPIESLDLGHQQQLMKTLKKLAEHGNVAILMVLHDINLAARYSDKLLALNNGNTIAQGSPFEVLTTENIKVLYNTEAYIIPHPNDGTPTLIL